MKIQNVGIVEMAIGLFGVARIVQMDYQCAEGVFGKATKRILFIGWNNGMEIFFGRPSNGRSAHIFSFVIIDRPRATSLKYRRTF